jgi:membrane protease YdiL (CAAX protease family)
VLNALSFGLSHLFYGNWVAPVLAFFGGLLFAWRYQTSRSLGTVVIEHALWGDFLFTTGIGWYFYSGAIR